MEVDDRYTNGKIYRLDCEDGHYYIGSTINKLRYRLANHKSASQKKNNSRAYAHINTIGWDKVNITLIEEYACNSSKELKAREDYYIRKAKKHNDELCLNLNRAHVTTKERHENMREYYHENKDQQLEKAKQYREQNKEKIAEYKMAYRQICADKVAAYNKEYVAANAEAVKERRRRYREANAEHEAAVQRKYVEEHKEAVNAYKNEWARKKREAGREERERLKEEKKAVRLAKIKEVHTCPCGGTYQIYRKGRHDSGKKHLAWTKSIADQNTVVPLVQ